MHLLKLKYPPHLLQTPSTLPTCLHLHMKWRSAVWGDVPGFLVHHVSWTSAPSKNVLNLYTISVIPTLYASLQVRKYGQLLKTCHFALLYIMTCSPSEWARIIFLGQTTVPMVVMIRWHLNITSSSGWVPEKTTTTTALLLAWHAEMVGWWDIFKNVFFSERCLEQLLFVSEWRWG